MSYTLDIFKYMHDGAVVITPNNRLSQHLIDEYAKLYQHNDGPLVKPLCFSYESWLEYYFTQINQHYAHQPHPLLLSAFQQRYLWQKTLRQDVSTQLLEIIQEAWSRCIFWQIATDDPTLQSSHYSRDFQTWYQNFQQTLADLNLITIEQLPTYFIHSNYSLKPSTLIWTCFDEFTPLQKNLQTYLKTQNYIQLWDDFREKPIAATCFSAPNHQEELLQAIAWAQQRLAENDQRIAIIVPNLQQQIETIQTTFAQHFSSDHYNISYGKPLNDYPIINTALQWLALDLSYLGKQQIHLLLQSPFIHGGQQEFSERSQILQDNPILNKSELSANDFLNQIKDSTPTLYQTLQTIAPYPLTASPYAWTNHFKQRLHGIGFPGDIAIDSSLYQCLNRLYVLFDEFMTLNGVTTELSLQEAIQTLRELARSTVFQMKKAQSPLTILGILEASGCQYDSIWITGLTDQCLPQKTKFSPFLPISMQKNLGMPHTHPQREFERAQLMLQRFGYASQSIVYSYPTTLADQPQLPCPLIEHYPAYHPITQQSFQHICTLETYQESYMHPPQTEESFSGGTALLASQAKCPFQAFAAHRLKIRPNFSGQDGLDLAERGQILHRVMEMIWTKLKDHSHLLRQSSEQLTQMSQQCIQDSLQEFLATHPATLTPLAQEVESQRLHELVHACLAWEKQREPFQIAALEQSYQFNLADLPLRVRIDRLDICNEPKRKIVIDYKTSLPTTKPWLEERPEAPQLLLYALLDRDIDTLIFLQLKAGRLNLLGLSATPTDYPGIQNLKENESWEKYQMHWKQELTFLANEIQQGYCAPQPKRPSICQQCSFQNLCRHF